MAIRQFPIRCILALFQSLPKMLATRSKTITYKVGKAFRYDVCHGLERLLHVKMKVEPVREHATLRCLLI